MKYYESYNFYKQALIADQIQALIADQIWPDNVILVTFQFGLNLKNGEIIMKQGRSLSELALDEDEEHTGECEIPNCICPSFKEDPDI